MEDQAAADTHLEPWFRARTREEIHRVALENRLVLSPLNHPEELLQDAHYRERGLFTEIDVEGSRIRVPGLPLIFSETPWQIRGSAPWLGAHTAQVIEEAGARTASAPRANEKAGERPLGGLRVVDFGWNWAGPLVTQVFADLGAEVIKVETGKRQDMMRFISVFHPFFRQTNRGKKSVTINMKAPRGVDLVKKLVARSDFLVENFAAGVMARRGLAYEDLREVNPRLIYIAMSMAGESGPKRGMRGFAAIATAYGGLEAITGYPERRTGLVSLGHGDVNASAFAIVAALSALRARERTGRGQLIEVSQVEAVTAILGEPIVEFQRSGKRSACSGSGHSFYRPHGIYPTAGEDSWVAIACATERERAALAGIVGATDDAAIAAWTSRLGRADVLSTLRAARVAAAPVYGMEEKDADPHLAARG
ncbi:MAG: CoA transferase, partial [Vicinamibacteria bacterium]